MEGKDVPSLFFRLAHQFFEERLVPVLATLELIDLIKDVVGGLVLGCGLFHERSELRDLLNFERLFVGDF